ncbi:Diaminopimelate epimerase [bioreactor metagenome]|uniref:diaminopimelate epimerase n=1 Tax=bioreactor metagenome TaxID=1076179 RepID=A0A645B243_9ZZZZ
MDTQKITYLSGSGNIFTAVDNSFLNEPKEFYAQNSVKLTQENIPLNRNTEGVIVLNPSLNYDFEVWFFNPDGSSGMMCGNGGRSAIYLAIKNGYVPNYKDNTAVSFEMNGKIYSGQKNNDIYSIYFPTNAIYLQEKDIEIVVDGKTFLVKGSYVDVGTDHYVIETKILDNTDTDIDKIDVDKIGAVVRNHHEFQPRGTNVNFFAKTQESNVVRLRTYERGVEKETGACGTGAISTALVYFQKYKYISNPLKIIPTSYSPLFVDLCLNKNRIDDDLKTDFNLTNNDLIEAIENIVLSGFVDELK